MRARKAFHITMKEGQTFERFKRNSENHLSHKEFNTADSTSVSECLLIQPLVTENLGVTARASKARSVRRSVSKRQAQRQVCRQRGF